ncbi:integrin alpha-D-like, partial [Passer montanus]|uniref:integrin alpha-D-like n=1 Tax=Passer montanus TaxID=9160 RepID=UPI001960AF81
PRCRCRCRCPWTWRPPRSSGGTPGAASAPAWPSWGPAARDGPPGAVNASLGLALAAGDDAALVCGPRSPQACGANVHLNGFCVQLDTALRPVRSLPAAFPACPQPAMDIAFLVDGSGSIAPHDFLTMKSFIGDLMARFRGTDAQ